MHDEPDYEYKRILADILPFDSAVCFEWIIASGSPAYIVIVVNQVDFQNIEEGITEKYEHQKTQEVFVEVATELFRSD